MKLVQWGNEHFAELVRLSADPRVIGYIMDGSPWTSSYALTRHQKALAHWEEHGFGWHAVLIGDAFVGLAAMMDRAADGIEIGWWVDPAHWGRGIATGMAARMRDMALARTHRVIAIFTSGNTASERVMVKIGMSYQHSYRNFGRLLHTYALERI